MSDDNVIGAFSEEQAASLSGVSRIQLRKWDRDGFFGPSFGSEPDIPYGRIYSFRDLVSLRILNDLRNNIGCTLQHLKEVSETLSHLGDAKWTATTIYVLGKKVVLKNPRTRRNEEVVSKQQVLDIPLRVVIANTRRAILDLNNRESEIGKVEHGRFTAQNQPVISGTRIPVSVIKEFVDAGFSTQKIIREYPGLTEADIEAAVNYQPEQRAA